MDKPTHSKIQREAELRVVPLMSVRLMTVMIPIVVILARQTQRTVRNTFYRTSMTCLAGQSRHTRSIQTPALRKFWAVAPSAETRLLTTTSHILPLITAHGTLILHCAVMAMATATATATATKSTVMDMATASKSTIMGMATTEVKFDPRDQLANEVTHYIHRERSYSLYCVFMYNSISFIKSKPKIIAQKLPAI